MNRSDIVITLCLRAMALEWMGVPSDLVIIHSIGKARIICGLSLEQSGCVDPPASDQAFSLLRHCSVSLLPRRRL